MPETTNAKVLCVDDEPNVLNGLRRQLRTVFDVHTAESGAQGLHVLEDKGPFSVVVSDMRMPEMDGAEFLSRVKQRDPNITRVLLTGQADLESSLKAVNEGQIFRYLTKPCKTEYLITTLETAVEQNKLLRTEKELLEKTLHGCIQVLTDALSLVNPLAFCRVSRIKRYVNHALAKLNRQKKWQIQFAAMLSQIGCITVPEQILSKSVLPSSLDEDEAQIYYSHPKVAYDLIKKIPRLHLVSEIVGAQFENFPEHFHDSIESLDNKVLGVYLLRIANDLDCLLSSGDDIITALDKLKSKKEQYHPDVLILFDNLVIADEQNKKRVEATSASLSTSMTLDENIYTSNGVLMVSKGQQVTDVICFSIKNIAKTQGLKEPFYVLI